jgi:hypothetical protein
MKVLLDDTQADWIVARAPCSRACVGYVRAQKTGFPRLDRGMGYGGPQRGARIDEQEFTYERRAGLLAHETGRRSEADRSAWQHRLGQFESALEILKQGADYRSSADQIEGEINAMRVALAQVPKEVRSQSADETELAHNAEQAVEESLVQANQAVENRKQELTRWTSRVAGPGAKRYTAEDRSRVEKAEATMRGDHRLIIESATAERDGATIAIGQLRAEEAEQETILAEARELLAVLDRGGAADCSDHH